MKHEEITNKIIQAFYIVYNTLGYGFLEKVYKKAMYYQLIEMGFKVDMERRVLVYFKKYIVGDYNADLTVNDVVICELKTHEKLSEGDEYQLLNYLRGTNVKVGLLLNFGKKPEIRRKIYVNEKKAWYTTRITPF